MKAGWHDHPGVRAGHQLTRGERAADRLRNGMGSWAFVFAALAFLAVWMGFNRDSGFDRYPFILLNLVLSCLAALQGAILLIAAKRSDQIASELAKHDYHADVKAEKLVEKLTTQFEYMATQHEALHRQVAELTAALHASGQARPAPRQAESTG
jgi:uncharacterized membrane protein